MKKTIIALALAVVAAPAVQAETKTVQELTFSHTAGSICGITATDTTGTLLVGAGDKPTDAGAVEFEIINNAYDSATPATLYYSITSLTHSTQGQPDPVFSVYASSGSIANVAAQDDTRKVSPANSYQLKDENNQQVKWNNTYKMQIGINNWVKRFIKANSTVKATVKLETHC